MTRRIDVSFGVGEILIDDLCAASVGALVDVFRVFWKMFVPVKRWQMHRTKTTRGLAERLKTSNSLCIYCRIIVSFLIKKNTHLYCEHLLVRSYQYLRKMS